MATAAHLATLHRGVEVWNQWRAGNPRIVPDLGGAALSWRDLRGANLANADLRGADLRGASLVGADLRGSDLTLARLGETVFGNTRLLGAKGLDSCRHTGPSTIDHRTLIQSGVLPQAFLRGCGLPDAFIANIPALFLEKPIQFYSCFISYSHSDKVFARELHDALQMQGIRCWLDEKQLLPGDDLYEQIDRGIRLWDKLLLCCSENALTSWWVDNEIETAFQKERERMREQKRKVLVLIPLDLDGFLLAKECTNPKAPQLRSRFIADFRGWPHDKSGFCVQLERLVRALRVGIHQRENSPVSLL